MLYTWDITIPADTPEDSPVHDILELSAGVITKIGIKFPAGCHGMVGVRLLLAEGQIFPIPRGEWVTGDDEEAESIYYIEFGRELFELKIEAISPDTDYNHTISIRITVLPAYIAAPFMIIADFVRIFKRLMGME